MKKWGLATTASQISGSINCDFYLFPHEVTKKKQVREDEAPADNKKVRKSRIQSAGSVSTNYCDFSKHLIPVDFLHGLTDLKYSFPVHEACGKIIIFQNYPFLVDSLHV